jgi:sialate O-acetylesterase
VAQAFNASAEIAAADDPAYRRIRVFTVGEGTGNASAPLPELATIAQPWAVASSASIGVGNWSAFSAVCWFTARNVFNALNGTVPLGLVSNNWGGTAVELWVPPPAIAACPGGSGGPSASTSRLYNSMIAPYVTGPMAAAAVLWFQVRRRGRRTGRHEPLGVCAGGSVVD